MGDALTVSNLTLRFGGLVAVDDVSFNVPANAIVAVIGPNGAGKTSLFNVVTGLYRATAGTVLVHGEEPVARWTRSDVCWIAGAGLFGALLATLAAHVVGCWLALGSGGAVAVIQHLAAQPWPWLLGPALFAGAASAGGAWTARLRGRRSLESATRAGLARTFQNLRLFRSMTVRENVLVAIDARAPWWLALAALIGLPAHARHQQEAHAEADLLLLRVGLDGKADARAGSLPYGHQRRLEIARALATRPRVLLLDEPAAGMNPTETDELIALIRRIREAGDGVTIILIEHDMRLVMNAAERIVVLHHGKKLAEGTPAEVRAHPEVVAAYLGKSA